MMGRGGLMTTCFASVLKVICINDISPCHFDRSTLGWEHFDFPWIFVYQIRLSPSGRHWPVFQFSRHNHTPFSTLVGEEGLISILYWYFASS